MDAYRIAFAAAWDAGMKNMRDHGRQQWTAEDFSVAEEEFNRIMEGEPSETPKYGNGNTGEPTR